MNKKIKEFYGKDKISDLTDKITIKHTTEQIDYAIDKIYKCFKRLEILK